MVGRRYRRLSATTARHATFNPAAGTHPGKLHGLRMTLRADMALSSNRRQGTRRMHTGEQYHNFMLASESDRAVRGRFQKMALDLLGKGADILDFGAGTGIDAKTYSAHGHHTFVYEPSEAMRDYLGHHCQDEIVRKTIVPIASPDECRVQAVTANFAVLNHIDDHAPLFEELSRAVDPGGFVLASMLNPYFLGDARYGWWRRNLLTLMRDGHYAVASESRIHRFTPRIVARAAKPYFRLERITPRGLGLATHLYMFLLLRRI